MAFMSDNASVFHDLMAVIEDRRDNPPPKSYTTSLFRGGAEKIGAKLTEETGEAIQAAREPGEEGRQHLIHEAADVLYHLFVLMGYRDVGIAEVETELARRFGVSGLDEKASRKSEP
jgi:phosphoribosyl-ATP pyrophosphohydrolase